MTANETPFSLVLISGFTTMFFATALAYVLLNRSNDKQTTKAQNGVASYPTESSAIDRIKYPGGKVSVYFATQTGTAESFARTLEREGDQHGFKLRVIDLEDVVVEKIMEDKDANCCIVLSATYGEGEAPDNATTFVRSLCEKAGTEILFERSQSAENEIPEPSCLEGVQYCVFGLGNRQYDHFNAMGKFFDHAFERLGAERILALGAGDDDGDLETDFETWRDTKLWPTLKKLYVGDAVAASIERPSSSATLPTCPYVVEYHATSPPKRDFSNDSIHASSRHYFTAVDCPIKVVRELRTYEDSGSTVHVEVDISKTKDLNYQTADNLGVLPMNEREIVDSVAKSLGIDLDQVFSLKAAPNHEWHGAPFPMPLTVRECLTRYCDLTGLPRRSDLKLLVAYAKDVTDQKALLRMSSKEGRSEYREKIADDYIGLVQILKLCPSLAIPLEHFLYVCPMMQTRFFTISSSSSVHPNTIHLTVTVTAALRKDGSEFKGVCSNYLAALKAGSDMIRVYNRPSSFRLPKDSSLPIILIGPGTGVAPMRALLQERAYQRQESNQPVGSNLLYFGCKKESHDYLYRDELEALLREGVLSKLRLAFSRQSSTKVYVQHLLLEDGEEIWKLIDEEGAHIYLCGGVKMGQDVSEALNTIVATRGNLSQDQAKEYLAKMSSVGRFVQELWA
jgi:NADPH-ferrihemoprotein reductase